MEEIKKHLTDLWVGKKFCYKSKYGGEVIGEIKDVGISTTFTFDQETSDRIREAIRNKKSNSNKHTAIDAFRENLDTKKSRNFKWVGNRYTLYVISTNNQRYLMNEIYIISDDNNI